MATAAVYQKISPDGSVSFSNQPSKNGERVTLPKLNLSKSAPEGEPENAAVKPDSKLKDISKVELKKSVEIGYKEFAISSPINEQTFHNQRQISVQVSLQPALRAGDKVQLYLDGKPLGQPQAITSFTLNNINRGQHQLMARVFDKTGRTLGQTDLVTIYIHYATIQGKN